MAAYSLQGSNVFSYSFPNSALGATNYLLITGSNYESLNLNATPWTIECWVKHINNFPTNRFIIMARGPANDISYAVRFNTSGTLNFDNLTNTTNSGERAVTNAWAHIAVVSVPSVSFTMFINGIVVYRTTTAATLNNLRTLSYANSRFTVGGVFGDSISWAGQISNLRVIKGQAIYSNNFIISSFPVQLPNNAIGPATGANVAGSLTGNVVLLTCASDRFEDLGNTGYTITPHGAVFPRGVPTAELESFSYHFASNGTCLVTSASNSLNLNTNFTIETWIYPTKTGGTILNRAGGPNNAIASYWVGWDNANINFAASSSNTTYDIGSLTGTAGYIGTPTLNAWNHIAITRSNNDYYGFLNGNLTYTQNTANIPYGPPGTRTLTIGGDFQNGQTWGVGVPANTINGYISNLRIIRGSALYNAAFTTPKSPLGLDPGTALLTAASPGDNTVGAITGNYEDLSGTVTISSNGTSTVLWSSFGPFTANALISANTTTGSVLTQTFGYKNYKIIDKIDYTKFAAPFVHNYTIGCRLGKIIDKVDYTKFASPNVINAYTIGNRLGKIISAVVIPIKYAYIPSNTRNYDPNQYQFWS